MKNSNLFKQSIKIIVSLLLFIYLLKKININELFYKIKTIDFQTIVLPFAISIMFHFVNAFKWNLLLPEMKYSILLKTIFKSHFYSTILPGQLFGETSKVLMLAKRNSDNEKLVSSILIDKIIGLISLSIIAFVGILLTNNIKINGVKNVYILVFLILTATLFIPKIVIIDKFLEKMFSKISNTKFLLINKINSIINNIYHSWKNYIINSRLVFIIVILGIITQLLGVLSNYSLSRLLGYNINFVDIMWIYPSVSILLFIPITIGGIGLRDLSYSKLFSFYNISHENSLLFSLILTVINILISLIGGIITIFDNSKKTISNSIK